jgi:hypothetical protein
MNPDQLIITHGRVDSPITTFGIRPPLKPDDTRATTPCPACGGTLTEGELTAVFVGMHPEQRDRREAYAVLSVVLVHAACAGVEPDKGIRRFLAKQGHDLEQLATHEPETASFYSPTEGGATFTVCAVCGPENGQNDAYPCRFLLGLAELDQDADDYNPEWNAS